MATRNCACCGQVTYNTVLCGNCIDKGITVEMVKDFSLEDLKLVSAKILKAKEDKDDFYNKNHKEHDFVLEMIDARMYPHSYRIGC